jgi:general secretion pathway protein B
MCPGCRSPSSCAAASRASGSTRQHQAALRQHQATQNPTVSYILEALKKSQSDRELGQVPRIEGFGRDVPLPPPQSNLGAYLALLLALLALAIAVLLLLRTLLGTPEGAGDGSRVALPPAPRADSRPPEPQQPAVSGLARTDAAEPPARPRAGFTDPAATPERLPELLPPPIERAPEAVSAAAPRTEPAGAARPLPAAVPPPAAAAPPRAVSAPPAGAIPLDDPGSLSVEPEVLVVPAPAPPGEPLPRGAEELRRALLGDGQRLSASVDGGRGALPAPPPPGAPLPAGPASEQTPVPEDLIAEIEAFKDLVRKRDPGLERRAAARPPPLPEPPGLPRTEVLLERAEPVPAGPSLALRNRLPPFAMSVHVYNADPSRRFVYINGRKLTEQEKSREGIRLERVVADGAVLSFEGEEFFQRR